MEQERNDLTIAVNLIWHSIKINNRSFVDGVLLDCEILPLVYI